MPFSNNLLAGAASASGGVSLVEVGNSAMFDEDNGEHLSLALASAGNRRTWTQSLWFYFTGVGARKHINMAQSGSGVNYHAIFVESTGELMVREIEGTGELKTTRVFRDIGWYHIVLGTDTTQSTTADRWDLSINGVVQTVFTTANYPALNYESYWNSTETMYIGSNKDPGQYWDGYLAEYVFIDGTKLAATSFGEFDETGLYWTPKSSDDIKALTFGTNGFYLANTQAANIDESAVSSTAATISYTATASVDTNKTDYSGDFDGVAIGTANSTRRVFVNIDGPRAAGGTHTISSCVIGGVSAALVARKTSTNGDAHEIWSAVVPSGTTADIDISANATLDGVKIGVWSVYDAASTFLTYTDSGTTLSVQADIPTNAVCLVGTRGLGYTNTFAGVTEDFDGTFNGGNASSAGGKTSTSGTPTTVSSTWSSTHSDHTMIVVVCLPADGPLNHFTNNNTVVTSTHTPTNSFATLNPLNQNSSVTLSAGNLIATTTTNGWFGVSGTMGVTLGDKFYWEAKALTSVRLFFGLSRLNGTGGTGELNTSSTVEGTSTFDYMWRVTSADEVYYAGSNQSITVAAVSTNDICSCTIDTDGTVKFYKNGTVIVTFSTALQAGDTYFPVLSLNGATSTEKWGAQFGSTGFDQQESGFNALNTQNITSSTTRTVSDPYEHWANLIWSGNSGSQTIDISAQTPNGSDFTPDWTMIKSRSFANGANIFDVVRGPTKGIATFDAGTEDTNAHTGSLFSAGQLAFSGAGDTGDINNSGRTYVGWTAKLGGSAVSNTDGTITSSVSVNTTLGISVGTYTGTGVNATIGHGLGVTPGFIIQKQTSSGGGSWRSQHQNYTSGAYGINMESTDAQNSQPTLWNSTFPTSSVFHIGTNGETNGSGDTCMFIAHAPSEFTSIGSFEGNGNADGSLIPTINSAGVQLQPIWVMIKSIDSTSAWHIYDAAREGYNVDNDRLERNSSATEGTADEIDIVTGGIKLRIATDPNVAETYIYIAIGIPIIDTDGRLLGAR